MSFLHWGTKTECRSYAWSNKCWEQGISSLDVLSGLCSMVQAVTAASHMAGPGSAATRPLGCSSQPGLLQDCFIPRAVLCFCLVEMQKVAIGPFLQCVWTPWMAALPSSILTHLHKLVSPANFMSKHWAPSNCFRNFSDINTLLKEAAKYTPGHTNHSWPESSKQAETEVNNHSDEKL